MSDDTSGPLPPTLSFTQAAQVDGLCDRFEAGWRSGSPPAIADLLTAVAGPARAVLLTELVAIDVGWRRRNGEEPTPETYAEQFPHDTDLIASAFDRSGTTQARTDRSREKPPHEVDAAAPDGPCAPGELGSSWVGLRIHVLRRHARGGLGEVFVARDEALNREVALKAIRADFADDPHCQSRFLREAEITGGLEHPGIVPIYGLGRHGDGRPFYIMPLIRGRSLQDAIAEFHKAGEPDAGAGARAVEFRKLLGRFLDVCNAVDYAHSQGVLHRDLKPSNIMLGPFGEALVVDWGLAKVIGRSAPADAAGGDAPGPLAARAWSDTQTLPGSALGTPQYMSPEQAAGDLEHLDRRSDVYSLGATLYALLTGRAPFDGKGAGRLLEQVRNGEFPRPRLLIRSIPAALESICLKAMALEPADRYPSVRALAEDIERWLADEPVLARPEPLVERARRWMRRRRSTMIAAAAVMLMALAGLAVVLAVRERANRELSAANDRERARFDLAMDAIKTFHTGVSGELLLKESQFHGLRTELLHGARAFFGKLEALLKNQTDRRSRLAMGQAYDDLAALTDKIGSKPEALDLYRRALAIRRELARETPADAGAQAEVGRRLLAIGDLQDQTGQADLAMAAYDEARSLFEQAHRRAAPAHDLRADLAACDARIGELLAATGRRAEALSRHQNGRSLREALVRDRPEATEFRSGLAASDVAIGILLWQSARPAEAVAAFQNARALFEALAREQPSAIEFRRQLARCYFEISYPLHALGKTDDAIRSFEAARAIFEALVEENPNITEFRRQLANSNIQIGILLWDSGRQAESLVACEKARPLLEALARDHPAVTAIRNDLARCYDQIAHVLSAMAKPVEAMASSARALALREAIVAANPSLTGYQSNLALTVGFIGVLERKAGRFSEAAAGFRRAIDLMDRLPSRTPEDDYNRACFHAGLAALAGQAGSGLTAAQGGPRPSTRWPTFAAPPPAAFACSRSSPSITTSIRCAGEPTSRC